MILKLLIFLTNNKEMTLNTSVMHYTNADIVSQVASYFDVGDYCVQAGDTDKRYKHVQ